MTFINKTKQNKTKNNNNEITLVDPLPTYTRTQQVSTCEERRQDNQNSLGEGEARHANIFHHFMIIIHSIVGGISLHAIMHVIMMQWRPRALYVQKGAGLGELNIEWHEFGISGSCLSAACTSCLPL